MAFLALSTSPITSCLANKQFAATSKIPDELLSNTRRSYRAQARDAIKVEEPEARLVSEEGEYLNSTGLKRAGMSLDSRMGVSTDTLHLSSRLKKAGIGAESGTVRDITGAANSAEERSPITWLTTML